MDFTTIASIIFISVLFYILSKLFEFYGISANDYGYYVAFYVFILISLFVLPTGQPSEMFDKI